MNKNQETKNRKPYFFTTEENGICKQLKIKHKALLSAIILVIIIVFFGLIGLTGCKKKDNGSTTSSKTTQKEKTFNDYWIFIENDNYTSEKAYNNISLSSKESGKNNVSTNTKNYGVKLKAKENIKIKSISYTFSNDSSSSTKIYDFPNNIYTYNNDNQITYLLPKGNDVNDYLIDLEAGKSIDKTISYDNLIIKKGEELYITAPNNYGTNNENWFFYNFKLVFDEVKS